MVQGGKRGKTTFFLSAAIYSANTVQKPCKNTKPHSPSRIINLIKRKESTLYIRKITRHKRMKLHKKSALKI
jgi:hypothetical protein